MQDKPKTTDKDFDKVFDTLFNMLADKVAERINNKPVLVMEPPEQRVKVYGMRGLANYIPCCLATAQKLKNSGKIPFYHVGNKVFFYSDEIDNGLKN